jgi:MraZ protein
VRGGGAGPSGPVRGSGAGRVFLSTFEKQLDAKRRIVVPLEFRAAAAGPFSGVFCFPSIEADCIEGGGKSLFDRYQGLIEELPFGDPLRLPLETAVYGGMNELSYDTAGRITLPDSFCQRFGLSDWVAVVGLGDRFQIWDRDAFRAHRAEMLKAARSGLADLRRAQRPIATKGAAE